jgi:hypothetical protein
MVYQVASYVDADTSFDSRPLEYVAGPYMSPDPVENTHRVTRVAGRLIDGGLVTPVLPHLAMLWHLIEPRPLSFWYEYDLSILTRCDAVLRFGRPVNRGR